jgi:hypothetical protein
MKRLTIAMSEDLYGRLLGYAADQSKQKMKRLSLGETLRTLVSTRLDEIGYEMPLEVAPRASSKRGV